MNTSFHYNISNGLQALNGLKDKSGLAEFKPGDTLLMPDFNGDGLINGHPAERTLYGIGHMAIEDEGVCLQKVQTLRHNPKVETILFQYDVGK